MDERSKCDLPYGHFGRGDYDLRNSTWRFERALSLSKSLRPVEDPTENLSLAYPSQQIRPGNSNEPRAKRHARHIQALVRLHPELHPISETLGTLLKVSEAVEDAVRNYDPLRGGLISFAHVRSAATHRTVLVGAYASGESGCNLRVTRAVFARHDIDEDFWLEVPSLSGEGAILTDQAPIQQISFASRLGHSNNLLAVRRPERIDIFQLCLSNAISSNGTKPPLMLNRLYNLKNGETFGRACADVAFNPWFSQQIGIADCHGYWRVYEFASQKLARIAKSWSSSDYDATSEQTHLTDGWARVAWAGNLETLVVCTRTTLRLFSIAGELATKLQEVDIPADAGANTVWAVDLVVLPHHEDHFCVVTSQYLAIYQVKFHPTRAVPCTPKLRFRHYRNAEDLSLRVSAWKQADTMHLLLYAVAYSRASVYRVATPEFDQLVAEEVVTNLPIARTPEGDSPIRDIHVHALPVLGAEGSEAQRRSHANEIGTFYGISALRSDHSLSESIWHNQSVSTVHPGPKIPRLAATKVAKLANVKVLKEEFVSDDHDVDDVHLLLQQQEPTARRARRSAQAKMLADTTINIESVANEIVGHTREKQALEEACANATEALLQPVSSGTPPLRMLNSFARAEMTFDDVNHASKVLNETIKGRSTRDSIVGMEHIDDDEHLFYDFSEIHLPSLVTAQIPELCRIDLSSIYASIVANWISCLPDQVSGRVRVTKVELARSVAVELFTATHTIFISELKHKHEHKPDEDEVSGEPSSETWELPVRSSGLVSSQMIHSSPPTIEMYQQAISALPTPSPTATPSITTASSGPSNFAAPELLRLSRYTTFQRPTPAIVPRSLSNILSHWEQGQDIDEYDWLSTSRRLDQRDDEADEEMTERERKRMQRRAERHIRRQRKEVAASQAQQLASSQAAEIFSASQPAALAVQSQPLGAAASSQSQGHRAVIASQVVPGRFGGRPPKKKRKQGF